MQFDRRSFMQTSSIGATGWLSPLAASLAAAEEASPRGAPVKSLILLWLAGGPSQLETFDPHPNGRIGGGTKAIETAAKGTRIASTYPKLAEEMQSVSLVRSLTSKEGDHERGVYAVKTGYRPDPTVIHPSIGAICCHELPVLGAEIPRHISILPYDAPGKGGYFGHEYDAFQTSDPLNPVSDITARISAERAARRLLDRDVIEREFARGRGATQARNDRDNTIQRARTMMTSEQVAAFDVSREPESLKAMYGDTAFGRGCLAARRLIEVGARCVEVNLPGWDTHINNHEGHAEMAGTLDPAFAALLRDLREQDLLDSTLVLCGGEFGRTPEMNRLGGRDHWPKGFSMAIAGGGIRGGQVIGATDPAGSDKLENPRPVADLHATIFSAFGVDYEREHMSPVGRPIRLCEGTPIEELLNHS